MHANVMNFIYREFMYMFNVIYGVFIQIAFDLYNSVVLFV